jgi:hypothetical protein
MIEKYVEMKRTQCLVTICTYTYIAYIINSNNKRALYMHGMLHKYLSYFFFVYLMCFLS